MSKNDIAIIGVSFEFPNAHNLDDFWFGLLNGKCFYHIGKDDSSNIVSAWGSVRDSQVFDYRFFGYSYKEACCIDPQQRLLLQHSWHALENAGYMNLEQTPLTSVFASASINNYLHNNLQSQINSDSEDEIVLGNTSDFIATRIAYKLNLKGPALNIQCGCSSGLAAIHAARVSLLTNQCDLSLVGAASLSAPHDQGYPRCPEGIRSTNGEIRSFDRKATGTVFTNGVAVLVLKRYVDAYRDDDHIYGVITSSALNNDGGQKASFTAPTASAQTQVIQRAMRLAKVAPQDYALIEAHGTGTSLGDPIEFEALCRAFGIGENEKECALQSVKANVGHLDTVSGLAGLIKAMLVLEKQVLPPQIHFCEANPKIDLQKSPFFINTKKQAIDVNGKFAGVTALGIGGTNAHVILRCHEEDSQGKVNHKENGLLLLSAKSKYSIDKLSQEYQNCFNKQEHPSICDASYTSIVGRSHFNYRKAFWAERDRPIKNNSTPAITGGPPDSVVFLFPGQGSQYVGMGCHLYQSSSLFKEKLDSSLNILSVLSGVSYREIIFGSDKKRNELLYQTEHTQPVLFVFEVALGQFLIEIGVRPIALLGHSLGEYVALVVSGALDMEQATRLVLKRAELMSQTVAGAMLSVMTDRETLERILPGTLDIAAYNAPQLITVSGSFQDIDQFANDCASQGIFSQKLQTSHAFHSRYLDPILEEYNKALSTIKFQEPQIPIISNVDAHPLTFERLSNVNYWLEHMRQPVNFQSCIQYLQEADFPIFLEAGPGKTLTILTEKIIGNNNLIVSILPHPKEQTKDTSVILQTLGKIWENGHNIDWLKGFDLFSGKRTPFLPLYPFEPKKCWIQPKKKTEHSPIQAENYNRYWKQETIECDNEQEKCQFLLFVITDALKKDKELADVIHAKGDRSENLLFTDLCGPNGRPCSEKITSFIQKTQQSSLPVKIVSTLCVADSKEYTWNEKQDRGALFILNFLKVCSSHNSMSKIKELIVLTNTSTHFQSLIDPAQAVLQSMIKTANQEYPIVKSRLIDVDISTCSCDQVVKEIRREPKHPIVLIRSGERFIEKFEKVKRSKIQHPIKQKGCVIVLGGTGHVGLQYAHSLLQATEQSLILVQRSPIENINNPRTPRDQEKARSINELRSLAPNRIYVLSADITDEQQLRQVCQDVIQLTGSIDTIIHTAGVDASMHYKLMKDVDEEFFHQCFCAKRYGLINISKIAKEFNVRHCHIISSISSVLAGIGMYVYGGVHAYIDGFVALMRKTHPSKWTSVNWEAWEVGTKQEEPENFQQGAFGEHLDQLAIKPKEGIAMITSFWNTISGSFIISSSELNERYNQWVVGEHTPSENIETVQKDQRPELMVEYAPPRSSKEEELGAIWSDILAIEKIGIDDNFFDLGGHSLMALQMVHTLGQKFNKVFSIVDLFEFPTIRKLSGKLFNTRSQNEKLFGIQKRLNARKKHLKKVAALNK